MRTLPTELIRLYETLLAQHGVLAQRRPYYLKWMRYYWVYCHKYALVPNDRNSFPPFDEKLRTKGQSDFQRQQAHQAIDLYYAVMWIEPPAGQPRNPSAHMPQPAHLAMAEPPVRLMAAGQRSPLTVGAAVRTPPARAIRNTTTLSTHPVSPADSPPAAKCRRMIKQMAGTSTRTVIDRTPRKSNPARGGRLFFPSQLKG